MTLYRSISLCQLVLGTKERNENAHQCAATGNLNSGASLVPTQSPFLHNMSYFRETSPGQWSFNDAVQYYSKKDPSLSHRTIVRQIKEDLERLAASKDLPNGKAAAAYLKSWKRIKKLPLAKGKEKELVAGSSSGGGISIGELNVGGVGNHISLKRYFFI